MPPLLNHCNSCCCTNFASAFLHPSAALAAKKARIDRGDKADLIDNEGFEGRPAIRRALATLGTIEGYAVGGCCDLSTSTHRPDALG